MCFETVGAMGQRSHHRPRSTSSNNGRIAAAHRGSGLVFINIAPLRDTGIKERLNEKERRGKPVLKWEMLNTVREEDGLLDSRYLTERAKVPGGWRYAAVSPARRTGSLGAVRPAANRPRRLLDYRRKASMGWTRDARRAGT